MHSLLIMMMAMLSLSVLAQAKTEILGTTGHYTKQASDGLNALGEISPKMQNTLKLAGDKIIEFEVTSIQTNDFKDPYCDSFYTFHKNCRPEFKIEFVLCNDNSCNSVGAQWENHRDVEQGVLSMATSDLKNYQRRKAPAVRLSNKRLISLLRSKMKSSGDDFDYSVGIKVVEYNKVMFNTVVAQRQFTLANMDRAQSRSFIMENDDLSLRIEGVLRVL